MARLGSRMYLSTRSRSALARTIRVRESQHEEEDDEVLDDDDEFEGLTPIGDSSKRMLQRYQPTPAGKNPRINDGLGYCGKRKKTRKLKTGYDIAGSGDLDQKMLGTKMWGSFQIKDRVGYHGKWKSEPKNTEYKYVLVIFH